MRSPFLSCGVVIAATLMMPQPARAQAAPANPFDAIPWQVCPCAATLGGEASVTVPAGFRFTGAAGTRRFLELNENPTNGSERGMVLRDGDEGWFAVFEYQPIGYVQDDEKGSLDAAAILESLEAGNVRGNEERRKRGWSEVVLRGWHHEPHYDAVTSNLTWSTEVGASDRRETWVNHSVRLLGRRGIMKVDLVAGLDQIDTALPLFGQVVSGFSYLPGQKYAEFTRGDRIAEYGLTALIAGGAGAVAAKSGLLGKLGKFVVYIALAGLALLKALWKRIRGRSEDDVELPSLPQSDSRNSAPPDTV
jgi:uncharacterized membrane-anchored protein